MKETSKITISSIKYKDNIKSKEKIINLLLDYILNNDLEFGDGENGKKVQE